MYESDDRIIGILRRAELITKGEAKFLSDMYGREDLTVNQLRKIERIHEFVMNR